MLADTPALCRGIGYIANIKKFITLAHIYVCYFMPIYLPIALYAYL